MIEYFSENIWLIWLFVSILCLIVELAFGDLFLLCFAIGALATSVASALGFDLTAQIIIFTVCSLLSILFIRPSALRLLHRNEDQRVSNVEAIMGRIGIVSETIEENGFGRVAIDGDDWKAVSRDGKSIEKGAKVTIIDRDSIILTVERNMN